MTRDSGSTPAHHAYIDALRGYAILGVMSAHVALHTPGVQGDLRALATSGQYGVQLFFVASALTLMLSWRSRADGAGAFYVRRLFRIAPMFWLAIPFYYFVFGPGPLYAARNGTYWQDVAATVVFLHGWSPRAINSIVPGGWSIAVEMTFYAIFPLLASTLRSLRLAAGAAIISIALISAANPLASQALAMAFPDLPADVLSSFLSFWIISQLPVFLIGIVSFFALREMHFSFWVSRTGLIVMVAMIGLPTLLDLPDPGHLKYALCFGALAVFLGAGAGGWLVNRAICWLGKVSYSAYLWHFSVFAFLDGASGWTAPWKAALGLDTPQRSGLLFAVTLTVVMGVTAPLSAMSHAFIEKPMIALGSRLVRWLRSPQLKTVEAAT